MMTTGCGGEGCVGHDTWPLHHLRHRGSLRRLCTSCVLRAHPGAFCCCCLALLPEPGPTSAPRLARCSRCAAATAHLACLPSPDPPFVCPACDAGADVGFSYFSLDLRADGRRRIDEAAARALLAAAGIAASSMSHAAAAARAGAERKMKEAVVARKRARDMVERTLVASKRVKEREGMGTPMVVPPLQVKPPLMTNTPAAGSQKREALSMEWEKQMQFHEPIAMAQTPTVQGVADEDLINNVSVATTMDVRETVQGFSQAMNKVGQEEEDKKGILMGLQAVSMKEEERELPTDESLSPRVPQLAQDPSVLGVMPEQYPWDR